MSQVTVKAMINKQKTKVLFVEANSDFTDILLSFLTMPLGMIAKLLEDHSLGSLSNLYRSLANLDRTFFVNEAAKLMLLDPQTSFEHGCPKPKLDIAHSQPIRYFTCKTCEGATRARNICMHYGSGSCDSCGGPLVKEMSIGDAKDGDGVGYTIHTASFVIYDDLRVEPYTTGFLQTIRNFDVADRSGAELRNVTFGIDEIVGLLRWCLVSETPLTDLILNNKTQKPSSLAKQSEPKNPVKIEKPKDGSSKYINLKITVQKSTKKLLFAQAEADFVEALFSFLTIPLGGVESLLDGNSSCLYRSLMAIDDKFFRSPDIKSRLMNPKLPLGYTSRGQFLPLVEENPPTLYTYCGIIHYKKPINNYPVPYLKSPKGLDNYVKEPTCFMVTNDLTVTPFGVTFGLTVLDRMNISLCDVDELEVCIGLEEVLGILRASIPSTSALSSVLINHLPKKLPKLEHQIVGQII